MNNEVNFQWNNQRTNHLRDLFLIVVKEMLSFLMIQETERNATTGGIEKTKHSLLLDQISTGKLLYIIENTSCCPQFIMYFYRDGRDRDLGRPDNPDFPGRGRGTRGMFRGMRNTRGMRGGSRGGYDNRGKREYDRQSGSDKT